MARNRKRAKERRARRPQNAPVGAPARLEQDAAPDPIQHASPDVELAEAQMALGRPALAEADGEEEAIRAEAEEEELDAAAVEAAAPVAASVAVERPHARPGNKLVNFLQGSWRELQRVQWPDRRQVMQATGVVIGFVIVAGVFLGVADFLAGKLMNFILK